jgi:hypothetical protein
MPLFSKLSQLGLALGLVAGLSAPALAQTAPFSDVADDYWAADYIAGLSEFNVISGFPDGTFRPNERVTRAQYAAILRQAFLPTEGPITAAPPFLDVPTNHWAVNAIYTARSGGFLAGYPGNRFDPESYIRRDEALVSLTNGLRYQGGNLQTLDRYNDADYIPSYARPVLANAIQANLVVNYPNLDQIMPYRSASRAEVAAFVYQALVREGRAEPIVAQAESWQSEPVATIATVAEKMSFSQTGQQLATLTTGGNSLRVWNPQTGALLREIAADETTRFKAIALNKTGTRVAVISQTSPNNSVELAVWSTETGELLWLRPLGTAKQQLSGGSFAQVAFSPNDQQMMSQVNLGTRDPGRAEGQLQMHDATTGEALQSLDYAADGNAELRQFTLSPDGRFLASASHLPVQEGRWRAEDRISMWRLEADGRFNYFQTLQLVESDFAFVDMTFTNSGLLNFLRQQIQGTRLSSWNVGTGDDYGYTELPGADRTDTLIRLSPDGRHYFMRGDVAGSRLGNVYTQEVKDLEVLVDSSATFSQSGGHLAVASAQDIRIFSKAMP